MASLTDPGVANLIEHRNHAVISTHNEDGTIHNAVVWVDTIEGRVAVNSAVGRLWPTNLERDPAITVLVYDENNPYDYVEIRGTAVGTTEGATEHIDRLAKKFLDADVYPYHQDGEVRITYTIEPASVRHQKQR